VSEAGFEPARPVKWALAPQASVSAVPPLRRGYVICFRNAAIDILPKPSKYARAILIISSELGYSAAS
jgi:hypothetical protein